MPHVRFTVRWMMAGIGVLAVILSIAIPVGRFEYGRRRTTNLSQRLNGMVLGLRSSCPRSVSPDVWNESVTWTQLIGPTNIYSSDKIPFETRERLVDALSVRIQGPIGPDLIPWIWDGYANMARGTSFEQYIRWYRCLAVGHLLTDDLAVRPKETAPDAWERVMRETTREIDAIIGVRPDEHTSATDEEIDRFLGSVAGILARPAGKKKILAVWAAIAASNSKKKSAISARLETIHESLGVIGEE